MNEILYYLVLFNTDATDNCLVVRHCFNALAGTINRIRKQARIIGVTEKSSPIKVTFFKQVIFFINFRVKEIQKEHF